MAVDVILGLQWGDEGKGKIVDYLADQYDVVCRFQGGPNAGHTIVIGDNKYVLHTIPSGIFRQNILNLVGNGVVLDPITFDREIAKLDAAKIPFRDRLLLSKKAHLILPTHRLLDAASEASKGKEKIGSTLKGIGPTYMDKTGRNGLRIGDIVLPDFKERYEKLKNKHLGLLKAYPDVDFDLEGEEKKWLDCVEKLRSFKQVNGEYFINKQIKAGKKILAEGAQGSMLDIDFGTYPYVTSSNTITAGVCTGLGIAPQLIGDVIGITKAYCTRVGSGPFPSELHNETGEKLRKLGHEFGATTGRPRRCGWIDLPQLKYTIMINGVTKIVLTKMDVLNEFETISIADKYQYDSGVHDELPYDIDGTELNVQTIDKDGWNQGLDGITNYDNLPSLAKDYVKYLEKELDTPISMVSTGPKRSELIIR
jgi:adenylosuccinate synthase